MNELDKKHDPSNNAELITTITEHNLAEMGKETDQLFSQLNKTIPHPVSFKGYTTRITRLTLAKRATELGPHPETYIDEHENIFPEWKKQLDNEYAHFFKKVARVVNVEDYGAVGDGKTDNTKAFLNAIGNGKVMVRVPAGIFVTKGIELPSWTCLIGEGKGVTTIKLHEEAPPETRLVTNKNHWRGNHHIFVEDLSLDWNVERLGNLSKTSTGGNHSSCLTYANVTFAWVRNVEAINPGLHCFDVTSSLYNYSGDGFRARRGSQYVWLDHLNGYGFGDDGITTHHSENILISYSHMCDPSGRAHQKGFSNSNGIEIDDGSRNVLLFCNSTARCFGGVEIKAHENSSAAANVEIIGHLSVHDNRSFNFRHIGHHKSEDVESKTAFNIKATNIVSIEPVFSELYVGSNPRGLVLSAYKNVVINNFVLVGDPDYDYQNNPVIAIQYRAGNVILNRITMKNFKKAGVDIKIFGGKQRADQVRIENCFIQDSAPTAIEVGSKITNIKIAHFKAINNAGVYCLKSQSPNVVINDIHSDGYDTPISIRSMD